MDFNVQVFLQSNYEGVLLLVKEKDILSLFAYSASSSCSVDKAVYVSTAELDYCIYIVYIQTPGSNISSY